jgi:hypothetical protein
MTAADSSASRDATQGGLSYIRKGFALGYHQLQDGGGGRVECTDAALGMERGVLKKSTDVEVSRLLIRKVGVLQPADN